jgi:outer membrane protein OmpA-like peptidoglycan-associated protein
MNEEAEYGLSIGDVMSALLLIIILVMMNALSTLREESDKANEFDEKRKSLYRALHAEFVNDFVALNMQVDTVNGVIEFSNPDVLFEQGKSQVKPEFKAILQKFYPRYIKVLVNPEFKPFIREIRIEGHTSSEWANSFNTPDDVAYLKNLELSQVRSYEVLNYLLQLPDVHNARIWFRNNTAAMGYSSSKLIFDQKSKLEDKQKSRRVSFRALLDYEQFMVGRGTIGPDA